MAGLVSVPIAADAAPDVVRSGNILRQLNGEELVKVFLKPLPSSQLDISVEIVENTPSVLHSEPFRNVTPSVDGAGTLISYRSERITPGAFRILSPHVSGLGIDKILVVHRAVEEEIIILIMTEFLGYLRDAPVVVGIFKSLGDAFFLKVERNIAERGVFGNAVVMGVGGGGLHRLESPLVIESRHILKYHIGKDGA